MLPPIEVIPHLSQWLAALTLSLGTLVGGTVAGWSSPYIAKLSAPDCTHPLKLTPSEVSWVASVTSLGIFIGAALGTAIQDFIGRKKTLLFASGPLVIGWALILIAPSVPWLYASRVFLGIAMGMIITSAGLFMGEIADPKIRGSLIVLIFNAMSAGTLLGTIMGGLLPLETYSYVCIVLTGLFVVLFAFVPESAYYHIANGDIQKAENSLKWYKKNADVKRETRELQDFIGSRSASVSKRFNEFKKPQHLKNLLVVLGVSLFLYFAGYHSLGPYTEIILRESEIDFKPSIVVMVLHFSTIVAGTIAMVLVDKLGRRTMLMVSGFGLSVGHILLGFHFHMHSSGVDPKLITWVPVLSLFLVNFSIHLGLSTGPDTLASELFPPILKASISFTFFAFGALMTFVVSKSLQPYIDLVGYKYVFWTFAASALSSVVYTYFCIPETARVPLIDIQENLKKEDNQAEMTLAQDVETNDQSSKNIKCTCRS